MPKTLRTTATARSFSSETTGKAPPAGNTTVRKPRGRPPARTPVVDLTDTPTPSYHHGDLPDALLEAALRVLQRDGLAGLGLRAIAREAGVSHTAPKHHFGDTKGLISELAARGYGQLRDAMRSAQGEAGADASARRHAIGAAYLRFAQAHPALFGLMFRHEIIDLQRPALAQAAGEAMAVLRIAMAAGRPHTAAVDADSTPLLNADEAARVTAAWACVHGLATLLIDGRLRGILKATTAFGDPLELALAALPTLRSTTTSDTL